MNLRSLSTPIFDSKLSPSNKITFSPPIPSPGARRRGQAKLGIPLPSMSGQHSVASSSSLISSNENGGSSHATKYNETEERLRHYLYRHKIHIKQQEEKIEKSNHYQQSTQGLVGQESNNNTLQNSTQNGNALDSSRSTVNALVDSATTAISPTSDLDYIHDENMPPGAESDHLNYADLNSPDFFPGMTPVTFDSSPAIVAEPAVMNKAREVVEGSVSAVPINLTVTNSSGNFTIPKATYQPAPPQSQPIVTQVANGTTYEALTSSSAFAPVSKAAINQVVGSSILTSSTVKDQSIPSNELASGEVSLSTQPTLAVKPADDSSSEQVKASTMSASASPTSMTKQLLASTTQQPLASNLPLSAGRVFDNQPEKKEPVPDLVSKDIQKKNADTASLKNSTSKNQSVFADQPRLDQLKMQQNLIPEKPSMFDLRPKASHVESHGTKPRTGKSSLDFSISPLSFKKKLGLLKGPTAESAQYLDEIMSRINDKPHI